MILLAGGLVSLLVDDVNDEPDADVELGNDMRRVFRGRKNCR